MMAKENSLLLAVLLAKILKKELLKVGKILENRKLTSTPYFTPRTTV
jgi:hypothetical protein